jgi:hypothetical protein
MIGLAAVAVKEVAVTSGLSTSLLRGIPPSAVDGFAAGTLLSGLCYLIVMAPRRGWRRGNRPAPRGSARTNAPAPHDHGATPPDLSAFADESTEIVVAHPIHAQGPELLDRHSDHQSKSGLAATVIERRPEPRRSGGRHAAPTAGVGSRVASKFALHP